MSPHMPDTMLFYNRIMRNLRRNWSTTILVAMTVLPISKCICIAQSVKLNNLPTGNEPDANFEDRYVRYRPCVCHEWL